MDSMSFHDITDRTKGCFIEGTSQIVSINRLLIKLWLRAVSPGQSRERQYADYIKAELTSSWNREEAVWQLVQDADHIWCQSYFDGPGADLFIYMLEKAISAGLRDKYFFDLAERSGAMYCLSRANQNAAQLMKQLETENNIHFIFWEEIASMSGFAPL